MADSPSTTILSRRNALAATSAALVIAPFLSAPAALAEANSANQTWTAKWDRFVDAESKYSEASNLLEIAEIAARKEFPVVKKWLPGTDGVFRPGGLAPAWSRPPQIRFITFGQGGSNARDEIEKHFDERMNGPGVDRHSAEGRAAFLQEGKRLRAKMLHELDVWEVVCAEIESWHNVPALRDAETSAAQALRAAEDDIVSSTDASPAAIACKLAYWYHTNLIDPEQYSDERAVLSALQAATSLAGLPAEFWLT